MQKMTTGSIVTVALTLVLASAVFAVPGEGDQNKMKGERDESNPAQRFAKLDTDQNGSVSLAEFTAGHEKRMAMMKERMGDKWDAERAAKSPGPEVAFGKMDSNHDGMLSKEEMASAPKMHGQRGEKHSSDGNDKKAVDGETPADNHNK